LTDLVDPHRDGSPTGSVEVTGAGDPPGVPTVAALRVVLVEDDPGDAFLVRELLELAGGGYDLIWCRDLTEGFAELDQGADCVLIDLGLPDTTGLDTVRAVVAHPTGAAVVVLTGFADRAAAADAVRLGAQDYLVKGRVDHEALARSIRYAIARRQSQESSRQLNEALLLQAESARMERGLVARPIIDNPRFHWAVRYQAGGRRALLGGDFFDAIELEDGTVRVAVGDICGHGADEAALGVALRVAWRALVLSGADAGRTLHAVERVLRSERESDETFATMCDLEFDPSVSSTIPGGHPPRSTSARSGRWWSTPTASSRVTTATAPSASTRSASPAPPDRPVLRRHAGWPTRWWTRPRRRTASPSPTTSPW
jgi:DNA-binding NarL/FixJ family response regulator